MSSELFEQPYSEELYQQFLNERKLKHGKKVNTDLALKLLRDDLEGYAAIGYNVDAILTHAIKVGWRYPYIPTSMEPKQTHLKPARNVREVTRGLVEAKTIQTMSDAAKQARADLMRMVGSKRLNEQ